MSFNILVFVAIISFYTAAQIFGLNSIIESNTTVQEIASYKTKHILQ